MTDEKLIACLLSAPTIREAAVQAGMSESAIYKKLREYSFRKQLNQQRALLLEDVRTALQLQLTEAVQIMGEIAADKSVPPQTRLNACDAILKHAGKIVDQIDEDTRRQITKEEEMMIFDL
ncbi:MAG: hypothetical protein J5582_15580 [Ruminococcus sp.]|uniref:hypothetical protein n=1 Tax=Ruminococcus sp. TaxID=41978 RepID=UPI0025EB717B|nr:hypothetical protein [Ruminococcus sp.]MBO4867961.1 hypothetical protein [Ruminococcus sp.]